MQTPEPRVVPPRMQKRFARVVLPRAWSAERLQPWAAKVPRRPDEPVPKHLLQARLFKCLANIHNLGKLESNDSMIAHAREAMNLKVELQTYLKNQLKHGPVQFPKIEPWSFDSFDSFAVHVIFASLRTLTGILSVTQGSR